MCVRKSILILLLVLFVTPCHAATIYMGSGETYTNLQAAMAAMSSGDTLIIRDGTYTGATNVIDNTHTPPSGPGTGSGDARFTIIQAETAGSVIFDGEATRQMFYVTSVAKDWIKFEGIIWKNTTGNAAHIQGTSGDYGSYIYFSKCGAYDAGTSGSGIVMRYIDHGLIEDCWVWGNLFYGTLTQQCTNTIQRRVVSRIDRHTGARGGNVAIYSVQDVEVQNCIAIDSDQSYSDLTEPIAGYYATNTEGGFDGAIYRGCIALNLTGSSSQSHAAYSSTTCANIEVYDCASWDTASSWWDRASETTGMNSIFNHCLFGENNPSSGWGALCGGETVNNSIMTNNNTYGFENQFTSSQDYNCLYDNTGSNYKTASARGAHDLCSENSNAVNPRTASLLYLTRIESATALATAGSDGGRIGPDITYQIGTTGTFYGETGYATTTATDLWPFPNEALIKTLMAAYSGGGVSGARGFCATGKQLNGSDDITLTSYIWEYLGNQMPSGIYDEESTSTPTISGCVQSGGVTR